MGDINTVYPNGTVCQVQSDHNTEPFKTGDKVTITSYAGWDHWWSDQKNDGRTYWVRSQDGRSGVLHHSKVLPIQTSRSDEELLPEDQAQANGAAQFPGMWGDG